MSENKDNQTTGNTGEGGNSGNSGNSGSGEVLIKVEDLKVYFPVYKGGLFRRKAGDVKAVDGVNFHIDKGETLGLVGESGSGKTTTGQAVMQLEPSTAGRVFYKGNEITGIAKKDAKYLRQEMQMIFQDPFSSLNPRMSVGDIVGEPMIVHNLIQSKTEYRERIAELLQMVGLIPAMVDRYPHEFSGGQRQRIGVARALAAESEFIICDEPVSALDVSIQAQIINLIEDLQEKYNLTYLFIAHDLAVVRHISDRIAVMYLGKIVEIASRYDLYHNPAHPYTRALLSAVPVPSPKVEAQREHIIIKGEIPSPLNPPPGCHFHPRCIHAEKRCTQESPTLKEVAPNHMASCFLCD